MLSRSFDPKPNLLFGKDGSGFIHAVNSIHELPYLPVIEIVFLGVPILIHAIWGIQNIFTAKYNSFGDTGDSNVRAPADLAYSEPIVSAEELAALLQELPSLAPGALVERGR